ncbi:hypothetical protein HBN50_03020 [Halobacteriovorax sp. GB3]|uniref:hypothetical protein n=1 Tax=Halobacteriovorax sp. GB3 TaxID=2719615 RepID=UPI00235E8D77|nr:hypothetical protein [Halobacteriovorax sp. GB3]MDD0852047.1 hypothetical protein [Halobacteriovorax sp. GB3]
MKAILLAMSFIFGTAQAYDVCNAKEEYPYNYYLSVKETNKSYRELAETYIVQCYYRNKRDMHAVSESTIELHERIEKERELKCVPAPDVFEKVNYIFKTLENSSVCFDKEDKPYLLRYKSRYKVSEYKRYKMFGFFPERFASEFDFSLMKYRLRKISKDSFE